MEIAILIINIILLLFKLPFFILKFKKMKYERKTQETIYTMNSFGFLISLIGELGSGKTSFQSALAHGYTVIFQEKLISMMKETKTIYKRIDFNVLDDALFEVFLNQGFFDFSQITKDILDELDLKNHIVFDEMSYKTTFDYFYDYVFAFFVLYVRNNYVYSLSTFYNRLTRNFNMAYKLDWQRIYDAYAKKDYAIQDYAVELLDEITDALGADEWRSEEKDESGIKEYLRKYRHVHQERNRMITSRQDATDLVKRYRVLTQSNLVMSGVVGVDVYHFIYKMVWFTKKTNYNLYKFFKYGMPWLFTKLRHWFATASYESYLDKQYGLINYLRNVDHYMLHVRWFIKSLGYARYHMTHYHRIEDIDKDGKGVELELYVPIKWAFSTYEEFAYKHIQKQLLQQASNKESFEINNIFDKPNFYNHRKKGVDGYEICDDSDNDINIA